MVWRPKYELKPIDKETRAATYLHQKPPKQEDKKKDRASNEKAAEERNWYEKSFLTEDQDHAICLL